MEERGGNVRAAEKCRVSRAPTGLPGDCDAEPPLELVGAVLFQVADGRECLLALLESREGEHDARDWHDTANRAQQPAYVEEVVEDHERLSRQRAHKVHKDKHDQVGEQQADKEADGGALIAGDAAVWTCEGIFEWAAGRRAQKGDGVEHDARDQCADESRPRADARRVEEEAYIGSLAVIADMEGAQQNYRETDHHQRDAHGDGRDHNWALSARVPVVRGGIRKCAHLCQ